MWLPHESMVWIPATIIESSGGLTTYRTCEGEKIQLEDSKVNPKQLERVSDQSLVRKTNAHAHTDQCMLDSNQHACARLIPTSFSHASCLLASLWLRFPVEQEGGVSNLVNLDEFGEGAVIHQLRERYGRDEIYTNIGTGHTRKQRHSPSQAITLAHIIVVLLSFDQVRSW